MLTMSVKKLYNLTTTDLERTQECEQCHHPSGDAQGSTTIVSRDIADIILLKHFYFIRFLFDVALWQSLDPLQDSLYQLACKFLGLV
jgi:hypothetical protein